MKLAVQSERAQAERAEAKLKKYNKRYTRIFNRMGSETCVCLGLDLHSRYEAKCVKRTVTVRYLEQCSFENIFYCLYSGC